MLSRRPRAVLFDWDGTLVDTAEASYRCYVRLFDSYGMAFTREDYARTYSPNWYQTFRSLGIDEEHWPECDRRWLSYFAEERIAPLPDALPTVASLAADGIACGIVTSGSRDRVLRELDEHGFAPYIAESVFGCDVVAKKPDPEALLLCLSRLSVTPADAVYVGDSPEDVQMARAAGVFSIAIPGTYPNRDALMAAGADWVCESLAALRV